MKDYKSMFEQAVRTLAAIDDALGIGDDGCGEPDITLTAIRKMKAAAHREALVNIPTHEQMTEILGSKLASDYPDECVENGENWELIAEIFYKAGFEAAKAA